MFCLAAKSPSWKSKEKKKISLSETKILQSKKQTKSKRLRAMSYQAIYLALSPGTRTGQVVEKGLQDIT